VRYTPSVFGFPDKLVTKLRYCDHFFLTSTSGAQGLQVYRWNSTFDPDFTNTGHQPLYRDTYASIYNHYAVISATAKIQIVNAVTTVPFLVGVVTDDDTSITSTANTVREMSHSQSFELSPLSGSDSNHTFYMSWDCQQILGIDPYASETYKTPTGSNPDETSFLYTYAYTTDASTNSVLFSIELVQTVLWTELLTPTGS